ncbi:hypothetical protein AB0K14_14090 [Actinosynnema sp. NPDC050801]|uniref:hypothetical protein n=1 Tax=unclassified Actinosynnema TaxID=2637065 RepID=UPI0034081520
MSIRRRIMAGIALPVVVAGCLTVGQGAASASPAVASGAGVRTIVKADAPPNAVQATRGDVTIAADSHGCNGSEVSNNSYVHVCFVRDGDKIWVRDDEANGRSAVGQIHFYDAGSWYYGYCLNPNSHASGIWVYCGFPEADENTTALYRGYDTDGDTVPSHFTAWQDEPTS